MNIFIPSIFIPEKIYQLVTYNMDLEKNRFLQDIFFQKSLQSSEKNNFLQSNHAQHTKEL